MNKFKKHSNKLTSESEILKREWNIQQITTKTSLRLEIHRDGKKTWKMKCPDKESK